MELLSGYSDAGINAFNANQNMIGNNLMNNINSQMAQQQIDMARWNAESARMAQPTPPGYGFVTSLAPSFGKASAPGTFSPGSGRSSFSGVSLGGGGSVFDRGTTPFNSYGLPGGGGAGSFSPSPNYRGGSTLPGASEAWSRMFNPSPLGPNQNFSPSYSPLSASRFTPQMPTANQSVASRFGAMQPSAARATPDLSSWYAGLPGGARAYNSWNLGLPAQGGFGVPGSLPRVQIHTGTPTGARGSTMPNYNSAARSILANREFTQPADFANRYNSIFARTNPVLSDQFNNFTQGARAQPFLDAYRRGTIAPAQPRATDFGGRSRSMLSPQQVPLPTARPAGAPGTPSFLSRYDWGTSFGARNPGAAAALRSAGAARAPTPPSLADRFGAWAPARNPGGGTGAMALQAPGGFNPFSAATYARAAIGGGINGPQPAVRATPNMAASRDALAEAMMARYGSGLTARDLAIPHAYSPAVRR